MQSDLPMILLKKNPWPNVYFIKKQKKTLKQYKNYMCIYLSNPLHVCVFKTHYTNNSQKTVLNR